MKTLLSILFIAIAINLSSQYTLSNDEWIEDLNFLKETVNEDYPFLFKKISGTDWNAMADELKREFPGWADHQKVIGLARLVSSFGYGHTSLRVRSALKPYNRLPIHLYQFKDGIYIEGAHKEYAHLLGKKLTHVEGIPIAEALKIVKPVFPAENDQFFKAYGLAYLCIPEVLHAQGISKTLKKTISFTLEAAGEKEVVELKPFEEIRYENEFGFIRTGDEWMSARDQSTRPHYLKHPDKIYYYEYFPDQKTVYVRHSAIQDDPTQNIPTFYKEVFEFIENNDVDKFILDVRANGGGNNYKNKPIVTGIIETKKINKTGHFFVIIGGQTFSACQNLVNELDNYTNVIFVGEPTGENINFYGDVNPVELPNSKINIRLSFAWWQDKPQWEGAEWMAPHLAVEPTFAQYVNNEDPVLDAVFEFDGRGFITDPMAYFTDLFIAGKMDMIPVKAKEFLDDSRYSFFNFEKEFNKAGYDLLGRKQMMEAMYVLGMNAQLFPESANAWDSLAEANWKAGNIEKAKELYYKAISLDPGGPTAKHAQEMLKQMDSQKQK